MAGLPHFLNSKAATKWYEPFYQNLFEVTILPPATVAGGSILIEHVNKISGLTQDKGTDTIEQKYKFATRSYASGTPSVAAAKIMAENGVTSNQLNGTGKDGRITKQDVVAAMASGFSSNAAQGWGGTRNQTVELFDVLYDEFCPIRKY